ncbi:unnamed protein product [Victoria cruziana]
MGWQWSAGKLVLILDAVHWNPNAPPRTLPHVCLRAMPGWGDGKRNCSEDQNWGSQCFSTPNEIRQPRDALLLTPKGSETELNLSLG